MECGSAEIHADTHRSHREQKQRRHSVATALTLLLNSLIRWNNNRKTKVPTITSDACFRGTTGSPPAIQLEDYIERIEKHSGCSEAVLIAALVYIDRLIVARVLTLTEMNVHRVLWSCIVVAHKFFEDEYFTNKYYSAVGGIPVPEMNLLERNVLTLLHHELFVSEETFAQYSTVLQSSIVYCQDVSGPEKEDRN
ncbi:cyclin-dependent protein [Pelomyxa schiedti]|nr:cyclin-dependent protein [Pelomyxa schiedti]